MYRGAIVQVLDARSAEREQVGLLMATGGRQEQIADVAQVET
jgi:hypothetical protein